MRWMQDLRRRLRHIPHYLGVLALTRLGPSPWARAHIAAVTGLIPLRRLVPRFTGRWSRLDIAYGGRRVRWHVSDVSELMALADVVCDEQYRLPDQLAPETIVDLGSNIGATILYFACRYPRARIFGIEADPATFRKLQANVDGLDNVEVRCLAVGD